MIKKEILNQMSENERRTLILNLSKLYFAVKDYFHYGLEDDLDDIEKVGRPVLNHLKNIIQ